jgi:hypothetical protein
MKSQKDIYFGYMLFHHIISDYLLMKNQHCKRRDISAASFKIWPMEAKIG